VQQLGRVDEAAVDLLRDEAGAEGSVEVGGEQRPEGSANLVDVAVEVWVDDLEAWVGLGATVAPQYCLARKAVT
jgi:hypothetical protein